MQDEANLEKLQLIKKQFLCNVPIKEIDWSVSILLLYKITISINNFQNFSDLNIDLQEQIIKNTVCLDQNLKYPVSLEYQKAFLKHLLKYLEKQDSVIYDSVYEEYGRLVALPCKNFNFKHYSIQNCKKDIILKENIQLISDGTTGLRTWQVYLSNYKI